MKLLVTAATMAALFVAGISAAVADDSAPGWAPSNCTPPLAAINIGPKGLLNVKTGPDVIIETRPGSHTLVFRRSGYDGSATVEIERVEETGATSVRVPEGDMRANVKLAKPGGNTLYVYLPGGTACPNGAAPPSM
jgi:hypothetical protein